MDAEGEGVTYISNFSLCRDFMCEFFLEIPTHMDEFARDERDIRDACFVSLFTNAELALLLTCEFLRHVLVLSD